MYTVAKGPTAILQKSRRGMNKTVESVEVGSKSSTPSPPPPSDSSSPYQEPELVFHPVKSRGKNRRNYLSKESEEEESVEMTEEYRQMVTYLADSWARIQREITTDCGQVKYHREKENPELSEFQPFDLEAWWGQKLYQTLTSGV